MEKIKRVISAFLALVLLLGMVPGVPMAAFAEEVEPQPEALAVETTEAAFVPEETEAPETTEAATEAPVVTEPEATEAIEVTEPAETEAETTVPQETEEETVPQETEPAQTEGETVPEETVTETIPEETIPAETVEETVPEETVEELVSSADAASGDAEDEEGTIITHVTGVEISAKKYVTYSGDALKLTAKITPENADITDVTWLPYEGEEDKPLDEDVDNSIINLAKLEDGILTVNDPATDAGKVMVYAVSNDVQLDEDGEEVIIKSEPIEVEFLLARVEINLLAMDDEDLLDEDDEVNGMDTIRVQSDKKVKVTAKYMFSQDGEEWKARYDVIDPALTWSLDEGGSLYATVKSDPDNDMGAIVYAKTVTERKTTRLIVRDENLNMTASVPLVVYSDLEKVEVKRGEDIVTGKTITVDLADDTEEKTFALTGYIVPAEATQLMSWKSDSNKVAKVEVVPVVDEEDEDYDELKNYSNEAIVTLGGYTGTAKITVAAKDDPSIKSTITIKTVRNLQVEDINITKKTAEIKEVVAGKSVTLEAADISDPEKPVVLKSSQIKWELPNEEDKAFATLTAAGKLTAKNVDFGKLITVKYMVIGNEKEAWKTYSLYIRPKASSVQILNGEDIVTGQTIYVDTDSNNEDPEATNKMDAIDLDFNVLPLDEEGEDAIVGAQQAVNWSSSSNSIAKVNTKGEVTWQGKDGTVTITATAKDGSGKKATVKILYGTLAESLSIECPKEFVRSGETVTMKTNLQPKNADVKVTWSLGEGGSAYAKITSAGKLTAKTIYQNVTVTVIAQTINKEGEVIESTVEVPLRPKNDGILVLKSDDNYVTKTTQILNIPDEETISLSAYLLGDPDEGEEDELAEDAKWKFSSSYVVRLDDPADLDGEAEFRMKKTGTATITVTCGSKKATITLKGVKMTNEIVITSVGDENGEFHLAAGKSLTLKAKSYADEDRKVSPTQKTLKWAFEEPEEASKYATITSAGKVTAKSGYAGEKQTVTVIAMATDGSGVTSETVSVNIYPIARSVRILEEESGKDLTGTTKTVALAEEGNTLQLKQAVYDADAWNAVKWGTSNKKIADVNAEGEVTWKTTGTVTITATAKDGSGKKASFKLKVVKLVDSITFTNSKVIAGGKTLTFKPSVLAFDGKKPTSTTLKWSIKEVTPGATAYVTSFKNGVLKTKTVSETKQVLVTAEAKDGSGVVCTMVVSICPATTSVQIQRNGENVTGTQYLLKGKSMALSAVAYPNTELTKAAQEFKWTSSNSSVLRVWTDEDGQVWIGWPEDGVVDKNGKEIKQKTGTVTITATAKDGTSKSDKITVKVYS